MRGGNQTWTRDVVGASVVVLLYAGLVALFLDVSPPADRSLDFAVGFETGDLSELGPSPVGRSGTGDGEVVAGTAHTGDHSFAMTVVDATAGTGVGIRVHNEMFRGDGYWGGENLPDQAVYSAWFYIPEYIDLGGDDDWGIMTFRQTQPVDSGYQRQLIDAVRLWDRGGQYGFTVASNIDVDGNWSPDPVQSWQSEEVVVTPGEWFHVEVLREYGGADDGRYTLSVNDTEIFDLDIATQMYGESWDKWGLWRRRWTVNNSVLGNNHNPNTHTLYVDDLAIRSAPLS